MTLNVAAVFVSVVELFYGFVFDVNVVELVIQAADNLSVVKTSLQPVDGATAVEASREGYLMPVEDLNQILLRLNR